MQENGRNGVSRRAVLAGGFDKAISSDPVLSRVMDRLSPESTRPLRRLRELQERTETPASQTIAEALGEVVKLVPVSSEYVKLGYNMVYSRATKTFPLGNVDIELTHDTWMGQNWGRQDAGVRFNPDTSMLDDVSFTFDGSENDTGRSDIGNFSNFRPTVKMTSEEEDTYMDEISAQGFKDYDFRVVLESVFQAVAYGERSTYWEDVAKPSLQVEELTTFKRAWYRELLSNRGIDPELLEIDSRGLPLRESVEMVQRLGRMGRLDAIRYLGRKAATRGRDLLAPSEI